MILGTEKFFLGDRGFFHGAEFLDGHIHYLADGFLGRAGVDAEDARVGVRRKFAENGVGEALLFADVLEEPRGHAATEKIVEDGGSKAAFVGKCDGRNTDADVDLFEVALGFEDDGRRGGRSGIVGVVA